MKVIVDTNIFISHLFNPNPDRTISKVLRMLFNSDIRIIYSPHQEHEFSNILITRKSITSYIYTHNATNFVTALESITTKVDRLNNIPSITRDPNDDYLLAYSAEHLVDYLITGDHHLLELKHHFATPQILTPTQFLQLHNSSRT